MNILPGSPLLTTVQREQLVDDLSTAFVLAHNAHKATCRYFIRFIRFGFFTTQSAQSVN